MSRGLAGLANGWGRDPGGIGLRRGIRAAIALPVAVAITLYLAQDDTGAVFTAFGTCGLLITADYAGSWQRRLSSYLITGLAGTVVLAIGWAASQSIVAAIVVTAALGFALSFVALLRGMLAVGAPALLLVYIVAVCVGGPPSAMPSYVLGWWVAVVISTLAALLVLPHDVRHDIRIAMARAFAAGRDAVQCAASPTATEAERLATANAFGQAVAELNRTYDGKPYRPTGASQRDRALALLVSHLSNTGLIFTATPDVAPRDLPPVDGRQQMTDALIAAMDELSRCMTDASILPSALLLDDARELHRRASTAWVLEQSAAGTPVDEIAAVVHADHTLRIAVVMAEQSVELARQANGGEDEDLVYEPPLPVRNWATVMRAHVSWHSPWLRIAVRTGLGLALAITVVQLTGVEHGFWVLLGVTAVLRYDMTATRRFALYAVIGTVVGVALGTLVLMAVGGDAAAIWVALPITVFLAAWAPVVTNFPLGQAAFSMFILVLLGIVQWPPDLRAGLVRVEDIAIGAGVAFIVGVLLWPSGAAGVLHREVAGAIRASRDYLLLSVRSLYEEVSPEVLLKRRTRARLAVERGSETYDMAIMQRGPVARDTTAWAGATNGAHLLLAVGRTLRLLRGDRPILATHPDLVAAVQHGSMACDEHWSHIADELTEKADGAPRPEADPPLPVPLPVAVESANDAEAYVTAVWTLDWLDHLDRVQPKGVHAYA